MVVARPSSSSSNRKNSGSGAALTLYPGRGAAVVVLLEQEELRLRGGVDLVPHLVGALERVLEHAARIALEGVAGRGIDDVTDHPGGRPILAVLPWQYRERLGVGLEAHVRLLNANEAFDRGAVEVDAFGKRFLGLSGRHGDVLDRSQNVGELQPKEVDVFRLDFVQYLLFRSG
ncbi:putative NAD/FAD-dependent oxidoreductase [Natrinema pallidum DSM 3751]|uniref:Putative NAD/FAD-dependent oxidoreductase n=1 Tax=Natrinema pallidum DSM 3751 TaxID=1227495 RepID=L9YNV5_9EURY|nr:putative NAD/FAD-dependent oxidoreductase [Natrinema pallidum DSM 3751]